MSTRPRGFAPWNPREETLRVLAAVEAVLDEYRDYQPLTIRQVFYRLVGQSGFPKTEAAYAKLCEILNRGRRAGYIPFAAIRDDGVSRHVQPSFDGPDGFRDAVANSAASYQRDRQEAQERRLWLLCEAGGMAPMLASTANRYGVPVHSSGGFDSVTSKYDLARELALCEVQAEILHVGDLDPSGVHLFRSLADDVTQLCVGLGGQEPKFARLAVTPEQAAEMDLPTAPPKKTDRRAFEGETVQAEAIPPDVLGRIVQDAITSRQDPDAMEDVLALETWERDALPNEAGPVVAVRRDGEVRAVPGPLIFNGELDAVEAFKAGHS